MSETSRSRLYELGQKKLDLELEQWTFICEHIGDFCFLSDQKVKEKFGIEANEDICVGKEKMSDQEFVDFIKPIIEEILERYGFKRKRKRVKINAAEYDPNYEAWLANQGQKLHQKIEQGKTLYDERSRREN